MRNLHVDENEDFFKRREFYSYSSLPNFILHHGNEITTKSLMPRNKFFLNKHGLDMIINTLKNKILDTANNLVETLKVNYLVKDKFIDPNHIKAIMIAGLFKNESLVKNSKEIDFYYLVEKFYKQIRRKEKIQLVIAWGQAKHTAGGLKSEGPGADSAELIAMSFHLALIKAISIIYPIGCNFYLISGGTRFIESLYSDLYEIEAYDQQRQIFAKILDENNTIKIFHYKDIGGNAVTLKSKNFAFQHQIPEEIYYKILLSINWEVVIEKINNGDIGSFGKKGQLNFLNYFAKTSGDNKLKIRTAIVDIISKRVIRDIEYNHTLQFMSSIVNQSSISYIATQINHSDSIFTEYFKKHNIDPVRLTVHNKSYSPQIPAMFVLGKEAGNQLPQHASIAIDNKKITYLTTAEALMNGYYPVYLTKNTGYNFDWLQNQSFLYVKNFNDAVNIVDALMVIK